MEWHEALDNIRGEKVIIIMTTNNIDVLRKINHGSLIRPGRVNHIVHFSYVTRKYVNKLLQKHFDTSETYFTDELPEETLLVPADIINIIKEDTENVDAIKRKIVEKQQEKEKKEREEREEREKKEREEREKKEREEREKKEKKERRKMGINDSTETRV